MVHGVGGRWFGHVHPLAHPLVLLAVLLVLIAAVGAVVLLVIRDRARRTGRPVPAGGPPRGEVSSSRAEAILDERFARGEIDDDEYQRRRSLLRAAL